MNPFLAELYNTSENIGLDKVASDETQKLAQAAILDEMLKTSGVDLEKMSAADIVAVATEIFGKDSPLVKEAECAMPPMAPAVAAEPAKKDEKSEEEKEKEAHEKLAEADFLGRAMAHAYVNELREIEKKAAAQPQPTSSGSSVLNAIRERQKEASAQPASAIELLAQRRAEEILKEAQANQDPQTKLAAAVEARALELLREKGYQVE